MTAKKSITIRAKKKDSFTEVRLIIEHPMQSAHCRTQLESVDTTAHFIQELRCYYNQKLMVTVQMGPAIAEDPYFAFRFKGGQEGGIITVSWVDNQGNKDERNTEIH